MYSPEEVFKKSRENLIYEGLPARYSISGKMRIVAISLTENQTAVWTAHEFFSATGMQLTRELVETSYVEADSAAGAFVKKFEIKLIPEIFLV